MNINQINIPSTQNVPTDLWQICMAADECPHPGRDFPKIEPLSDSLEILNNLKNELIKKWGEMDENEEIDLNNFTTDFVNRSGKIFANVEAKIEFEEEVKIAVIDHMWGNIFMIFLGRDVLCLS
jgi:hypothetical protein